MVHAKQATFAARQKYQKRTRQRYTKYEFWLDSKVQVEIHNFGYTLWEICGFWELVEKF